MLYSSVHRRLKRLRGKASAYPCIKCGNPAQQWAYQHNGSPEFVDSRGCVYAEDPVCYEPMCRSCHRRFDAPETSEKFKTAARANIAKAHASQDRSDPAYLAARREAGRRGGEVRAARMAEDPELRERMAALAERNRPTWVRVCECGKASSPAGIGLHQKASGHRKYTDQKG